MARKVRHEEYVNHEAWAIPYGDLVTLLLAFFVVMYALSTLNEGKYRVMSESLKAAFDGNPQVIDPVQIGEPAMATSMGPPKVFTTPGADSLVNLTDRLRADAVITPIEQMQLMETAAQAQQQLDAIQKQVERALGPLIMSDQVTVTREGLWLEVNIRSDVLFASGSASLSTEAREVIGQLAGVLRELPNDVRIEGHTDNQPIRSPIFPSNWELSAARAASVITLLETRGADPRRMAVIGYGDKRPVSDNLSAEGRSANRRVMLVILATPGISQENAAAAVDTTVPSAQQEEGR